MVKGFFKSFGFEKVADGDGGFTMGARGRRLSAARNVHDASRQRTVRSGVKMDKNEIVKMDNNEIVSHLTPIFRDVFNDDALVVTEKT